MAGRSSQKSMSNINNQNEEEEIRGLLDSIKQQGMPYSEEPDPLYWANFRVRVMERVAEPERISLFAKAKSWLWESGLRTGLVGGGLAVLLLGGVYFGTQQDQQNGQVAVTTKQDQQQVKSVDSNAGVKEQTPVAPEVIAPNAQQPEIAQTPEVTPPTQEQPKAIEQQTESEIAAPLIAADLGVQGPATSLDDMTETELQALLASVEEMN
jgi:hypothetical protein